MLKHHASKIKYLNVLTDVFFTVLAYYLSFVVRNLTLHIWPYGGFYYHWDYPLGIFLVIGIWGVLSFYFHSKYYYRFASLKTDIFLSLKVVSFGVITILIIQYILKLEFFPRSYLIIFFLINIPLLILGRILQRSFIGFIQKRGYNLKTLLIVGLNERSEKLVKTLEKYKEWGLVPVGAVKAPGDEDISDFHGVPVKGDYRSFRKILHENPVDEVVFAFSFADYKDIKPLTDICAEEGVHYILLSDFFNHEIGEIYSDKIFGIPILYFSPTPRHGSALTLAIKRFIDIVISSVLLVLLAPLMLLIAILIKLTSEGPVFYRWKIVGKNKKLITSYKFRTMVVNADEIKEKLLEKNEMKGAVFKMTNDPRVTKIGRILRKYSLDELPQLWSVLKGDLSLVGPRPPLQSELPKFDDWQRRKLSVKPGLTCLWQISGRNKISDFNEWVKLDLEYIDNWSLWLDFKILLKTIPVVLKGTGK